MYRTMRCSIRVRGHLERPWRDWFAGLTIANLPDGEAMLFGEVPDQAALFGVLHRIQNAGMPLVSLHCVQSGGDEQ